MARLVSILLTLRLASAVAGGAGSLAALEADNGLRDAQLGAPLDGFSGLELVLRDDEARTETYVRAGDELRLGGATLDTITYAFYLGRLYSIGVTAEGEDEVRALREALEENYGPGELYQESSDRRWTTGRLDLRFQIDPDGGRAHARLTSRIIRIAVDGKPAPPARVAPEP